MRWAAATMVVLAGGGIAHCNSLLGANPPIVTEAGSDATTDGPTNDGAESDAGTDAATLTAFYADISAGQAAGAGDNPCAVIDPINGKLLVATRNDVHLGTPGLFRCDLDGTQCAFGELGTDQATGQSPSAVVDVNDALLFVATRQGGGMGPGLFRCALDGTACTAGDLSAGQNYGELGFVALDDTHHKVLVATSAGFMMQPNLFLCPVDGSACASSDISGGKSGLMPSNLLIDGASSKLLAFYGSALVRCDLDATNCITSTLAGTSNELQPLIDSSNAKLLVAFNAENLVPSLLRCELDGTQCVTSDISAGTGASGGAVVSAVVDKAGDLFVVTTVNLTTTSNPNSQRLGLLKCKVDGTQCVAVDISTGVIALGGFFEGVSAVFDESHQRLLVVASSAGFDAINALELFLVDVP